MYCPYPPFRKTDRPAGRPTTDQSSYGPTAQCYYPNNPLGPRRLNMISEFLMMPHSSDGPQRGQSRRTRSCHGHSVGRANSSSSRSSRDWSIPIGRTALPFSQMLPESKSLKMPGALCGKTKRSSANADLQIKSRKQTPCQAKCQDQRRSSAEMAATTDASFAPDYCG